MRKFLLILSVVALFGASLWAQRPVPEPQGQGRRQEQRQGEGQGEEPEQKRVNFRADNMRNIPQTDSMILVGNVVMEHNGAVITCDSAVRYNDHMFDCFRRVIINKDSTYIYCEMASYNGLENIAQVFDRLIKVVDGTATLYTYNFAFNTLDDIGRYWGGGYMQQDSNMLESDRGWYYSQERNIYAAGSVEMTDPEYKLISDSVRYNMDDEIAQFYTLTYIWNTDGDILSATSGMYYHQFSEYDFTSDAYILTEDQEVWADDIKYNSQTEDAVLKNNIQVRDEEQKTMAFGDFGVYWGDREEGFLTNNPALVTFDPEQDSLFVRADTMFVFTLLYDVDYKQYDDSLRQARELRRLMAEGLTLDAEGNIVSLDSLRAVTDSLPAALAPKPESGEMSPDRWMAQDDPAIRENLRSLLIEQKRNEYEQGDTLTMAILTATVRDSLLKADVASEDIEGQLLYNRRKSESADPTAPLDDKTMLEILQQIGMLTKEDAGQTEAQAKSVEAGEVVENQEAAEGAEQEAAEGAERGTAQEVTGQATEVASEVVAGEQSGTNEGGEVSSQAEITEVSGTAEVGEVSGKAEVASVAKVAEVASVAKVAEVAEVVETIEETATSEQQQQQQEQVVGDSVPPTKRELRRLEREKRLAEKAAKRAAKSKNNAPGVDSLAGAEVSDELKKMMQDSLGADSVAMSGADSLGVGDSTLMGGDTVVVQHDSLQRVFKGYYNVRIFRNDFQAVCDSMIGFTKDSTLHLHIDPILWNGQNQISADVIDIFTKNSEVVRAFFTGDPIMVSEVDTARYNQIKGREMEAFFRDNEIYYHHVMGNAQTLYYMMDDETNEPTAFMVLNSAEIMFVIDNQEMVRMTWNGTPDFVAHPIEDIPLDVPRFLEGFRWEADRRPTRNSIFDRPVRESQRAEYRAIAQPQFPLRDKIEKHKRQMMEQRVWVDRTETLPPYAEEFLRELSVERAAAGMRE